MRSSIGFLLLFLFSPAAWAANYNWPAGGGGSSGATGASGFTGATGRTGATGLTGASGSNGALGASGATGASGLTGATGSAGLNGTTGATGATGDAGAAGSFWFTGSSVPSNMLGLVSDLYLRTGGVTGDIYQKSNQSAPLAPVVWTTTNATDVGGTLTKTGGTDGSFDAGGVGDQIASSGDFTIQYTMTSGANDGYIAAIGHTIPGFGGGAPGAGSGYDFGIAVFGGAGNFVFNDISHPGGAYTTPSPLNDGDIVKIVNSSSVVTLQVCTPGCAVVYTSSDAPIYPEYYLAWLYFKNTPAILNSAESSAGSALVWGSPITNIFGVTGKTGGTGVTGATGSTGPASSTIFSLGTGTLSGLSANEIVGTGKTAQAATITYAVAAANTFSCVSNPTLTLYDCGTSAGACTAGTTALANVTLTGANSQSDGTVTSPTIAAGHYWAWEITAGTCASLNATGTAQ